MLDISRNMPLLSLPNSMPLPSQLLILKRKRKMQFSLTFDFRDLTWDTCDNSQFENLVIYVSVVDTLLLIYPGPTLSSVRHPSLLMFDSSFIGLTVLSLILTLFCHLFASSSFFFLASSSWEILQVSSASSVAYTHTHTNGKRVKSALHPRSLCSGLEWMCVCPCAHICSYAVSRLRLIAFLFSQLKILII